MYILYYICLAINLSVDTLATSIFSCFVWFFSEYTTRNLVCKYPLKSLFCFGGRVLRSGTGRSKAILCFIPWGASTVLPAVDIPFTSLAMLMSTGKMTSSLPSNV